MKFQIFPGYDDLFPGKSAPQLEEVLNRCPASHLLKSLAFVNSKIHLHRSNLAVHEKILYGWLESFEPTERLTIINHYHIFKIQVEEAGGAVVLFSPIVLLKIMMTIILRFPSSEVEGPFYENEKVLLEAWLLMNEEFDLEITKNTRLEENGSLAKLVINEASQYEFLRLKDFGYQLLVANSFFDFLSREPNLANYLSEFLRNKHIDSATDYLMFLAHTYADAITGKTFGFKISPNGFDTRPFFDSMAYDLTTDPFSSLSQGTRFDEDFKALRDRPLIRDIDGSYYILHYNFFVDKLYQGLLFDFYKSTSIAKFKKTFPAFLGYLGQEFAETYLFYNFIDGLFEQNSYTIGVPGKEYPDIEYSDYYARVGNRIFLFEFKNSIVAAKTKQSKSFSAIEAEIQTKFIYANDKGKKKGVSQLFDTIEKIADGGFPFDNLKEKKIGRLIIFPIIVYTDDFLSINGIQNLFSTESEKIKKQRKIGRHQIFEVTLIHLQDIIGMRGIIRAKKNKFKNIMETYFIRKNRIRVRKPRKEQEVPEIFFGFRTIVKDLIRTDDARQSTLDMLFGILKFRKEENS
jgi:hypothetical protein